MTVLSQPAFQLLVIPYPPFSTIMEDRETLPMRRYGESKTTRIMMATVRHVTSSSGLTKFQTDGFLFNFVQLWQLF